jgi:hypothetical protein
MTRSAPVSSCQDMAACAVASHAVAAVRRRVYGTLITCEIFRVDSTPCACRVPTLRVTAKMSRDRAGTMLFPRRRILPCLEPAISRPLKEAETQSRSPPPECVPKDRARRLGAEQATAIVSAHDVGHTTWPARSRVCWLPATPSRCRLHRGPAFAPRGELRGADLVAREIALVQAEQLRLCQRSELLLVGRSDMRLNPRLDVGGSRFSVHRPANHVANEFAQRCAVLQAKGVGLPE